MRFFFLACLLSFSFISCSSIHKSQLNEGVDVKIEANLKADIEVDTTRKLTGYASGGYLFHLMRVSGDDKFLEDVEFNNKEKSFFSFLSKVEAVKAAAAYNAVAGSNSDILVHPQYVIEENHWNPFYKQIKVKVTGYPGRIVSIR